MPSDSKPGCRGQSSPLPQILSGGEQNPQKSMDYYLAHCPPPPTDFPSFLRPCLCTALHCEVSYRRILYTFNHLVSTRGPQKFRYYIVSRYISDLLERQRILFLLVNLAFLKRCWILSELVFLFSCLCIYKIFKNL